MSTSSEVAAYFDSVARNWDSMRQDYYGMEVIEKAAAAAGLGRNSELKSGLLVDVGCGTGFLTAGLAPLAQQVIGIDSSQGMLNQAQENLAALGLGNVQLLQGSVDSLPLEDNVADAVFANMVLHHAPDPQIMVQEMARVAAPGGRVVITDMESHTNEWFRAEMADLWLGFTETDIRQHMHSADLRDIEFGWIGTQ